VINLLVKLPLRNHLKGSGMLVENESDLIQGLQNMISCYLQKNPQLTLNALALRSNVPVTTLRRVQSRQQKNELAPHSVLNLSSYLYREKNLQELLRKVPQVIADYLHHHFGQFIFSSPTRVYDVDLNRELKDQVKYFIYKLAANHQGTTWVDIKNNFGEQGRKKALELLSNGFLEDNGEAVHAKNKEFSLDLEIAASHLPELVSRYRPASASEGMNSFFSLSESLNFEGISEIRAAHRECVKKIHTVMNDPKFFGDIPYFTINLGDQLLATTDSGVLQ